ncbi:MAG TPA: hypothetical protein VM425_16960 [Myxococcota bacterium]|nr:hypothetical protein [Myxococcota bacterium]
MKALRVIWFLAFALLLTWMMSGCSSDVAGPNRAPVASAGPNHVIEVDKLATLDGSGSFDPDGDQLSYQWDILTAPEGATASIDDGQKETAHLTPDVAGVWMIRLVVKDAKHDSEPDVMQIRAFELGCTQDGDCNDNVECTDDTCNNETERCEFTPNHTNCPDDGDFCNGNEICDAQAGCTHSGDPCQAGEQVCDGNNNRCVDCLGDMDCDDLIDCTEDSCSVVAGTCTNATNDTLCPGDGVHCNGTESCDSQAGCVSSGDPCLGTSMVCDETSELCVNCIDNIDCNDGIDCTDDSCNAGTCAFVPNDAHCDDDGEYCNGAEVCDPGLDCQPGVSVDCSDGVGCTTDTCNEVTDICDHLADDGLCDNLLFCDGVEICDPAADCQAGTDPCPGQGCDEGLDQCLTCTGDPDCDDGNLCNGAETCSGGSCQTGADLGPGDYCNGNDLVTCNGAGNEISRVPCALGCNATADPDRCFQIDPSNLDPILLCANPVDLTISGPVDIDTYAGTITGVNPADIVFNIVSQGGGAPDIGVFSFNSIDIQANVTVTGSNALALLVCEDAWIAVLIDASSVGEAAGPGGWDGGNGTSDGSGYQSGEGLEGHSENNPFNETGGGGGGFGFVGGNGGDADDEQGGAGGQEYGTDELVLLVGGSGGGSGGFLSNLSDEGGGGGGGGGAVQISAGGDLVVTAAGGIHAGGAGGGAGPPEWSAGGGGGAGGAILLEGVTVTVEGTLAANGGGGGGANTTYDDPCSGGGPEAGQDGPYGDSQAAGGRGCDTDDRDGGPGGTGGYGDEATGAGVQPADFHNSGGGGGAAGRLRINSASGAATISGVISPNAASNRFTQGTVTTY